MEKNLIKIIYDYKKTIAKIAPWLSFEEALYLLHTRNLQDILHPYNNESMDFTKTIQEVLIEYYNNKDEKLEP